MNINSALASLKKKIHNSSPLDAISALSDEYIFIYGAGNYGKIVYNLLVKSGLLPQNIKGFLDVSPRQKGKFQNIPIKHPDDKTITAKLRKETFVVISIYCSLSEMREIRHDLIKLGYEKITFCYEIALSFHKANDPKTRISDSNFLQKNISNILAGISCWHDYRSVETYLNHFEGYASGDVNAFLLENDHKQYFAALSVAGKGYRKFVDCGAFTGDTLADLFEHLGEIDELFLFEPENENLVKLKEYLRKNKKKIKKMVLFPCGVWNQITQMRFDSNVDAASAISSSGKSFIQCVSIDEVLTGFSPTFIKMDIEGAELEALHGARHTIEECQPDLAICLYHSLSHFWEVPRFLKKICPDYKFFLRTYGAAGFETVLYAKV